MIFTFDPNTHVYELDGVELPGVTSCLEPLTNYGVIDPEVLERASRFGTALHKMVELYIHDNLDEASLDNGLRPALKAFKKWKRETDLVLDWSRDNLIVEQPMYHPRYKYAGTPDLIFVREKILIDLKSREFNPLVDPLQLAAYEELARLRHRGNYEKFVLSLYHTGTYWQQKAHHRDAWKRFRYLLDYQQMTNTIKTWR